MNQRLHKSSHNHLGLQSVGRTISVWVKRTVVAQYVAYQRPAGSEQVGRRHERAGILISWAGGPPPGCLPAAESDDVSA